MDALLLLSVGELNSNKNHEVVIRAMAKLNDESIHYAIVGTGELPDYLIELANTLDVGDRVHLLGFRDDVPDLYKAADVCVFPSIREGLGIAAIEGMASGLPLICADNRGTRDYAINGENAMVCRYDAADEFAQAVKTIMSNKDMIENMGKLNLEKSSKYDVKNVIAKMKKIYGETECQNRTLLRE